LATHFARCDLLVAFARDVRAGTAMVLLRSCCALILNGRGRRRGRVEEW
jgi:hypothetical protein